MSTPLVVVGSLNVDLVVTCAALPMPGQTVLGNGFHRFAGGKGANQAVAASRLGATVRHIGCVGTDDSGRWLIDQLREAGVDTSGIRVTEDAPTGTAVISVGSDGQNTIVVVPGANHACTPALVREALVGIEAGILLLQLEIPLDTVLAAATTAKSQGMTVILNPAPALPLPGELVAACDFLIPNETETSVLTEMPVTTVDQALEAAEALSTRTGAKVITTLGRLGAVYADAASKQRFHRPAWPVSAIDATAAGDAFVAALAAAFARGETLSESVAYASAAGALTATRLGAQAALPTADELSKFIREASRRDQHTA